MSTGFLEEALKLWRESRPLHFLAVSSDLRYVTLFDNYLPYT
jgi:hypothetical protein